MAWSLPFAVRAWHLWGWMGREPGEEKLNFKTELFLCFPVPGRAWQGGHLINVIELRLQCICWARSTNSRSFICCTLGSATSVLKRKCVVRERTHAIKCACSAMWETPAGLAQEMRLLGLVGLVLMMRGRYRGGRENDGWREHPPLFLVINF